MKKVDWGGSRKLVHPVYEFDFCKSNDCIHLKLRNIVQPPPSSKPADPSYSQLEAPSLPAVKHEPSPQASSDLSSASLVVIHFSHDDSFRIEEKAANIHNDRSTST